MPAQRVVIVGGGTAGTFLANRLAADLRPDIQDGKVRIQLLTDRDDHLYQPGLLYVPFGGAQPAALHRPESSLLPPEVELLVRPVTGLDLARRHVLTDQGPLPYDYLVLATGAHPAPQEIPGLVEGGYQFYTEAEALALGRALARFEGGRIVLAVGIPHKCPVAPLEFTFLLDDFLRTRGVRDKTEIVYTYPLGRAHTLETVAAWAEETLAARGVKVETFFNLEWVDPERRIAHALEGTEISYDLLVAVPPHQGAAFLAGTGIASPGNWIPVDRHTLAVPGQDRVWALGDATELPISKAGSTAHYQAEVLAANLVEEVQGRPPGRAYTGKVYCFIETGHEEATYISFDYRRKPQPVPPSRYLHLFKHAFNRAYWLTARALL